MKIKTQEIKKSVIKTIKSQDPKALSDKTTEAEADDDFDDNESLDSDQELQLAFARKQLMPGLNVQLDAPKEYVNDQDGLKRKFDDLYLKMDWIERIDVTVPKKLIKLDDLDVKDTQTLKDLADSDFKRESLFLRQAEAAVSIALVTLNKLGVKTSRPEDYFAEMAKSDEHMKRVRESLLSKHAEVEKREKIRKLRELKKIGKQVQIEVEKKKQQVKKNLKESIKKYKKGDKDSLEIELEDDKKSAKKKKNALKMNNPPTDENDSNDKKKKPTSKKASYKEKKYGFGGRKKRSKYNTAESYAEGYATKGNKGGKPNKTNKNSKFGRNNKKDKKFINKNKPKSR